MGRRNWPWACKPPGMRWTCLAVVALLSVFVVVAEARVSEATSCFRQASFQKEPQNRDLRRKSCLQKFQNSMPLESCLSFARRFDYSIHSEEAKMNCLFQNPRRISVQNCLKTSKAMIYGENKDEVLMNCFHELSDQIGRRSCLKLAQNFLFSHTRERVTSHCHQKR